MKNIIFFIAIVLFSCSEDKNTVAENNNPNEVLPETKGVTLETVFSGRGIIWGFDFLTESKIIFTERAGKIVIYNNGNFTELTGVPTSVFAKGQGGMLDIKLHPNYASNGWIYACYSSKPNENALLNLIRFKLNQAETEITNIETIFTTSKSDNTLYNHFGSRIVFDNSNYLYLSIGEGGPGSYGGVNATNKNAQDVTQEWGKVLRMTDTGGIPADNPVLGTNTKPNLVFSYGHRNPQGLALNSQTNEVFETEHGPRGGDEFNLIKKGANYGWPLVSYGINYDGTIISNSPTMEGVETPLTNWVPSIGTCGLAYISTKTYGNWKGDFITGGLAEESVTRIKLSSNNSATSEVIVTNAGRVRNVKEGKDGFIYFSTDSGELFKLKPVL
jgi:aldose sugar dehydrogenase